MSNLKALEKRYFEDLFQMGGGYVLDFTNRSFSDFIRDTVGIEIYSDKYTIKGGSKANLLRAFWDIESDIVVGKVLSEMLELWLHNNPGQLNSLQYTKCYLIVQRLLGREVKEEDPDKQFLMKDYGKISLDKIPIDANLIPILDERLAEAQRCLQSKSPLAVIFLTGSILEGILLGLTSMKPREFNQNRESPKDNTGKVKPFPEWKLAQLIDVACDLGFLKLDVKKFSHGLRDFRNYIHPHAQLLANFQPDNHTAEICLQVLKAAIASLSGDRN